MEKRLAFAYGRTLVLTRLILFVLLIALVATILAFAQLFPPVPTALFLAFLAFATILFAVSPLWTEHWLTRSRLILRQGWYFRAILPLGEIASATAADESTPLRAPIGIHRPLGQPTLYVTGSRTGLVILRLRTPRRFWSSFGLEAREIVIDVDNRDAFLKAFAERRALLAPVEADRADAHLRD